LSVQFGNACGESKTDGPDARTEFDRVLARVRVRSGRQQHRIMANTVAA
jgi:hypothetical protein